LNVLNVIKQADHVTGKRPDIMPLISPQESRQSTAPTPISIVFVTTHRITAEDN